MNNFLLPAVFIILLPFLLFMTLGSNKYDQRGREACAEIGATWMSQRGAETCVKPDGSMWKVPR